MKEAQPLPIQKLLHLRHCVLSLGEKHGWWFSSLLSVDSLVILEYIVPRTRHAAAVIAANEVGRALHDQLVGAGKLHLFRLPQAVEEKAFHLLQDDREAARLIESAKGKELEQLEEMSERIAINEAEGPVQIGSTDDLQDEQILAVFARHYLEAFKQDFKTYPYLA